MIIIISDQKLKMNSIARFHIDIKYFMIMEQMTKVLPTVALELMQKYNLNQLHWVRVRLKLFRQNHFW